ncbi:hypothetical protein HPB50_023532 [Hyalomma asiaticum]|uniref:Uncharacterized protein n=1 Tax=Hyalomma asiaticum TaxID=266040 RepID=A0ACB7RZ27_HYAAI|nr:hypothetical protein HPB50_023532 [Hyalomma asiaticum]
MNPIIPISSCYFVNTICGLRHLTYHSTRYGFHEQEEETEEELALGAHGGRLSRLRNRDRHCWKPWSLWMLQRRGTKGPARASLPVVLVNREGMYAVVAVLGVSIPGCAGVPAFSVGNYGKLATNADEVRDYNVHRGGKAVSDDLNGAWEMATASGAGTSCTLSGTVTTPLPMTSIGRRLTMLNHHRELGLRLRLSWSVSDGITIGTRPEECGAAMSGLQRCSDATSGSRQQ